MSEVGRPPIYTPDVLKKAEEYLSIAKDEEIQQIVGLNVKGTELYKTKLNVKLPSIEGLARYLNVARSTVYLWAKEYKEFSDILENILSEQAGRLINNGLSGDYNSTIAKLILTKHGYIDKSESIGKFTHEIEDSEKQMVDEILNQNVIDTPQSQTNIIERESGSESLPV